QVEFMEKLVENHIFFSKSEIFRLALQEQFNLIQKNESDLLEPLAFDKDLYNVYNRKRMRSVSIKITHSSFKMAKNIINNSKYNTLSNLFRISLSNYFSINSNR
mgnify:CR=1